MSNGTIWINDEKKIVLETRYDPDLVERVKRLIGRRFDGTTKQWSCALCVENVESCRKLAEKFSLRIDHNPAWDSVQSSRSVEIAGDRILIHGCNPRALREAIPDWVGDPATDEQVFRSIETVGDTTAAIPLRSWIIDQALGWIHAGGGKRIEWAKPELEKLLTEARPAAERVEQHNAATASALAATPEQIEVLKSKLPAALSQALMPHQLVAIQTLIDHPQTLLADEQGLGKTVEILASLEATQSWPAVVIAPATALLNWRDEAARWLPDRRVAVLGGGVGKKDKGVPASAADILIVNYESFGRHTSEFVMHHPKALVADEAQYLKGYSSASTKAVKEFRKTTHVPRTIAATGTPVMNRPEELLTLLTLLPGLLSTIGGFWFYAARYCRATRNSTRFAEFNDFSGAGNLEELGSRLRASGQFVRREKAVVLETLAPKQHQTAEVDINNRAEYTLAEDNLRVWLQKHARKKTSPTKKTDRSGNDEYLAELAGGDVYFDNDNLRAEALRQIGVLRHLAGVGKIPAAVEQIKTLTESGDKLVAFAYHVDVQQALVEAAKTAGLAPLSIRCDQTTHARHEAIQKFQTDPEARVIVCSISAAKTAITLTAAHQVLFVELDWSPANLGQAEDRVHRIGQTEQVVITRLVGQKTLDQKMVGILDRKAEIINAVTSAPASVPAPAPYGYKADGTPRLQRPGPGRRATLTEAQKQERHELAQALWRELNHGYLRHYMRHYREARKQTAREQAAATAIPQP